MRRNVLRPASALVREPAAMTFGTGSGPPATEKQIGYLESLLRQAGYTSYADARHPLGLTARQARGKFTLMEASAIIDQLTENEETAAATGVEAADVDAAGVDAPDGGEGAGSSRPGDPSARPVKALEAYGSQVLAAELARRGWRVIPPRPEA